MTTSWGNHDAAWTVEEKRREERRALGAALERTTGSYLPSRWVEALFQFGARVPFAEQIALLAAHAVKVGGGLAAEAERLRPTGGTARNTPHANLTAGILLPTAYSAARAEQADLAALELWLLVLVSDQDASRSATLRRNIARWEFAEQDHFPITAWGTLGPLVRGAGLSREEAAAQYADGTLDVASLTVLAGLRGYAFPDLLVTPKGQICVN